MQKGISQTTTPASVVDFWGKLRSGVRFRFDNSPVFYNVLTLILVLIATSAIWGAYKILQPFLIPLLWALLCGSVLHPFKYKVSTKLREWIIVSNTPDIFPVIIDVTCFPLFFLLNLSEYVAKLAVTYCWSLLTMICIISLFFFTPQFCISAFWSFSFTIFYCITSLMEVFSNGLLVSTMIISLILVTVFLPTFNQDVLKAVSIIIWIAISCLFSSMFGFLMFPIFFLIQLLTISSFIIGTTEEENIDETQENDSSHKKDSPERKNDGEVIRRPPRRSISQKLLTRQTSEMHSVITKHPGDVYIYWVAAACLFTLLIKFWWTPVLLLLLSVTFIFKRACNLLGIQEAVELKLARVNNVIVTWFGTREAQILFPPSVIRAYKMAQIVKRKVLYLLMQSVDCMSTIIAILLVVVFLSVAFMFLTSQVYMEGVYLVKVSGKVVNDTMLYNPDMIHIFPKDWREHLDSAINNAYLYGRETLSKMIRRMMSDINDAKVEELEQIMLELWDRVYQAWFINPYDDVGYGPKVTSEAVYQIWDRFTTPGSVGTNTIVSFVKNNMTILLSTLSSVWEFVKDNVGLVLYLLETVFSIILISGFAVLTFFIDVVVFLTALFYLLSSSGKYYKPVEFIRDVSPSYSTKLALAIERSVAEVFMVSFKLALFYGLYTWLLHTLFHMRIVYIPTACASIFAAIPFISTYWVCVPGVLDLWLVQGNLLGAICLFILQFAPTNIVDSTIYQDIHGGHPYLTGLSMAGGVLCFGMQGAIIGPLILCCMFVIFRFGTALVKEPDARAAT